MKTIKAWWPFLLVWILNAVWLVYYYRFGPYTSYEVTATQSLTALSFLKEALDALWKAGIYIWIQILPLALTSLPSPASILSLGLILISFAFLALYLNPDTETTKPDPSFAISLILIGIPAILLGRLPSLGLVAGKLGSGFIPPPSGGLRVDGRTLSYEDGSGQSWQVEVAP